MKNTARKVVVFDLNETLYRKSSKEEFFKFVCFRKGYKLLNLFQLAGVKLLGNLKLIDVTRFKENFFNYLDHLPPETVQNYAREYWQIEFPKYFNKELLQELEDLQKKGILVYIITGGLEVYVEPLLELLPGVMLLGTVAKYNGGTYEVVGKACKNGEKFRRLKEDMNGENFRLMKAYSDDKEAILDEAEEAWLVEDGKLKEYHS